MLNNGISPWENKILICYSVLLKHAHKMVAMLSTIAVILVTSCGAGDGTGLDINGKPIDNNNAAANDPFSMVQAVFSARCVACHAGAGAPQGLVLTEGLAYDALVNVASTQQAEVLMVQPNDAEASYLVRKIRGDSGINGAQMPRNGPPFLSATQIQTVIDWINQGAPRPSLPNPNEEFVAELEDFQAYKNWQAVDYSIGATNLALGSAHSGDNNAVSRRVFANPIARTATQGEYANGSILVKELVSYEGENAPNGAISALLAMVKRGADFNADSDDWEWFILSPDASEIQNRGGNVGMCSACHQQARLDDGDSDIFPGKDLVFAHPSEFVADAASFSDYKTWDVIDERDDDNPRLDAMAHGASTAGATRRVYKKQLYANPDTLAQGYPIGTILVKEVVNGEDTLEITAMVKRGGSFNEDNGMWEWFMLEPSDLSIADRGENLLNGMCNACHLAANPTSGEGADFVFKHSGDPFNNNEEFLADLSSFTDYTSWPTVDYTIGDVNAFIGGGHRGLDNNFSRRVYMNNRAQQFDGATYPRGSIFIKEVTSWQSGEREFSPQLGLVAMAKRGGAFNAEFGSWEWFELESDLSQIIGRGGNYRNGGCNSCHSNAMNEDGADAVFNHPSEYVASNQDFSDYSEWTLVDERSDPNPLLGSAHKANDDPVLRKVYKKQLHARIEDDDWGFPIGTTIVKEIITGDTITELVAMVKRGGDFNDAHQNWEWFMLDPASAEILTNSEGEELRGADLLEGGCNSCHAIASGSSQEGKDYVFYHKDDPQHAGPAGQ